jgi:hypothetical protein
VTTEAHQSIEVSVLIPYSDGSLAVVAVDQLVSNLEEGQSYDEAISNAAFDSYSGNDRMIERVRRSNLGGDYWADVPGLSE